MLLHAQWLVKRRQTSYFHIWCKFPDYSVRLLLLIYPAENDNVTKDIAYSLRFKGAKTQIIETSTKFERVIISVKLCII